MHSNRGSAFANAKFHAARLKSEILPEHEQHRRELLDHAAAESFFATGGRAGRDIRFTPTRTHGGLF